MRVVALLATFNEERFIRRCVEHLAGQGVEIYLLDNDSTDRTVALAERHAGAALAGVERLPRAGVYSWLPILDRKAELAASLDAEWFMHVDADEIRLPPRSDQTLSQALAEVDHAGYNSVNFVEFTFLPTREEPDHDHPRYERTMRWYYPFLPSFPHRLNAWKSQPEPVDLATSGGHVVRFPGLRMYPGSFPMRHYLFLSVEHAVQKLVERRYDPAEVGAGHHRARAALRREDITLPAQADLRPYRGDDALDSSNPFTRHPVFGEATARLPSS